MVKMQSGRNRGKCLFLVPYFYSRSENDKLALNCVTFLILNRLLVSICIFDSKIYSDLILFW